MLTRDDVVRIVRDEIGAMFPSAAPFSPPCPVAKWALALPPGSRGRTAEWYEAFCAEVPARSRVAVRDARGFGVRLARLGGRGVEAAGLAHGHVRVWLRARGSPAPGTPAHVAGAGLP